MKINKNPLIGFRTILIPCVITVLFYSCAPGEKPSRKKMPGFNGIDAIEGNTYSGITQTGSLSPGFAFATTEVDLDINGASQRFVRLALPNASTDGAIISLVNSVKPFALPLLSSWAGQQHKGVVIDLSAHNGDVKRIDYILEKPNDFSIPVVIMWDNASATRVETLKALVDGMPSVTLKSIDNKNAY